MKVNFGKIGKALGTVGEYAGAALGILTGVATLGHLLKGEHQEWVSDSDCVDTLTTWANEEPDMGEFIEETHETDDAIVAEET